MAYQRRRMADSLFNQAIYYVVKNLDYYIKYDIISLTALPPRIKDQMLRKFTSSSYFWKKVDFKTALATMIHRKTANLNLSLVNVNDEILEILQDCHNLKKLYLTKNDGENLTSQKLLEFLSSQTRLDLLQLSNCAAVNDSILLSLSTCCTNLTGLDVYGCENVSDAGVEGIASLKYLQWLTLSSTQVTNSGIEKLICGPSGPNIKELRLANCRNITSDILGLITQCCPSIEVLVFYNVNADEYDHQTCCPFQEGSLKHLKQFTWTVQW